MRCFQQKICMLVINNSLSLSLSLSVSVTPNRWQLYTTTIHKSMDAGTWCNGYKFFLFFFILSKCERSLRVRMLIFFSFFICFIVSKCEASLPVRMLPDTPWINFVPHALNNFFLSTFFHFLSLKNKICVLLEWLGVISGPDGLI